MPSFGTRTPFAPRRPGDEDSFAERRTLRDYYIILRERMWIALPLALLIAVGLVYVKARETPLYSARATMQFEKPERIVIQQEVIDPAVRSETDLTTYLQVLGSARIRAQVIQSFTPDEIAILQRPFARGAKPGAEPPTPADALGEVTVNVIRNSFLIAVSVVHRDPEAAALVANRYIDQFILHLLQNVSGTNEVAVEFLRRRAEELRQEAELADQRLQDYQRKHNLLSLDSSTNIIQGRLLSVNSALQTARLERITIEELFNQVQLFQRDGRNLLEIAAIANHGTLPTLRAQLDGLRQTESVLGERYLERHPRIIEVSNQIAIAEEQLRAALALAVADLRTSLEKARNNEAALEREYATNERDQLRLRDLTVEYRSLENQAAVAKNTYIQILDRLNQTTTARSLENVPVRPLDRATPPAEPFTPNLRNIVKNAIAVFVLVFVGVGVGLSFLDDRIKSAWDVETFLGTPLLGIIPDLGAIKDPEKYSLVRDNRQVPGTESFLSVYSSIKIQSKLDFPKSLLVTSTIPGEGKTLVSSNVAASFARHGKRTLLVDCDLRRPMLHRHYAQENTRGLIPWFEAGGAADESLISNERLGI
ncbi:MAG TPA: exopolysaccharide transport family protein, partial [Candidatus Synoicihabitans sp.]|nr:exopolysaccharide transport family protein [Candidatus Synoicihabitans sp.]